MRIDPSKLVKQDKRFRARLIGVCLTVGIFVAVVYVAVSYRLTSDLLKKAEFSSLSLHIESISRHIFAHENITWSALSSDLNESSRGKQLHFPTKITFSNKNEDIIFLGNSKLPRDIFRHISARAPDGENEGQFSVDSKTYLWFQLSNEHHTITAIAASTSYDLTMKYVAKRLSLVTFIMLWVVVWLALTLSSYIAKRVEEKNEQLIRMATHDLLTGLPNRLYLVNIFEKYMNSDPDISLRGCMFVIDLDKFKEVNDSFGHSAGDSLLLEVASRLRDTLDEQLILSRVGGDEFMVWGQDLSLESAPQIAKTISEVCDQPVEINGLSINIGASIGIAHLPTHASEVEPLIVCADTAMYKAKRQKLSWVIFETADAINFKDKLSLRSYLPEGLKLEQFVLYFQPKVNLVTREILGLEALVRWQHPERGMMMPDTFIDIVETGGRVQEFGRYVISKAISQLYQWQKIGISLPIAVNLSPNNLLDLGLVGFISDTLTQFSVSPSLLEIELTENETSLNIDVIKTRLSEIKAIGVTIAIDDFGTGMSSLAYLSSIRVDVIKIDRVFVKDLMSNEKHKAIVATALSLSTHMQTSMVVEGIETSSQAELLISMGCSIGQGYLYYRPMSAEDIRKILSKRV